MRLACSCPLIALSSKSLVLRVFFFLLLPSHEGPLLSVCGASSFVTPSRPLSARHSPCPYVVCIIAPRILKHNKIEKTTPPSRVCSKGGARFLTHVEKRGSPSYTNWQRLLSCEFCKAKRGVHRHPLI